MAIKVKKKTTKSKNSKNPLVNNIIKTLINSERKKKSRTGKKNLFKVKPSQSSKDVSTNNLLLAKIASNGNDQKLINSVFKILN